MALFRLAAHHYNTLTVCVIDSSMLSVDQITGAIIGDDSMTACV